MPNRSGYDEWLLGRGRWSKGGINRRTGFFVKAVAGKRGFQFWDGLDRKWENRAWRSPVANRARLRQLPELGDDW
jgi:hypothetical protein